MEETKRQHYEAVLADLEAQRRELELSITLLRRRLGEVLPLDLPALGDQIPGNGGLIRPDTFAGMSIAEAAKKFLRLARRQQSTGQIVEALERGGVTHASENFAATVASVLSREARRGGDLVRVARGEWGLRESQSGQQAGAAGVPAREAAAA